MRYIKFVLNSFIMIVYCLSIDVNAVNMYIIMCVGLYAYKLVPASERHTYTI